jgi:hypothetical protein
MFWPSVGIPVEVGMTELPHLTGRDRQPAAGADCVATGDDGLERGAPALVVDPVKCGVDAREERFDGFNHYTRLRLLRPARAPLRL